MEKRIHNLFDSKYNKLVFLGLGAKFIPAKPT